MDTLILQAFSDELQKIAADEKSEANKLFGLPLTNKPSGTKDYELGQEHDEQVAMEEEAQAAEEQAMMAEQQAAAAPPPKEKKPGGDKKKSDSKKGSEKVKVEVHVDGKKTDAKEKKSQPVCYGCGRILRGDMDCDCTD